MFFEGSRYAKQQTYQTTAPDGTIYTAVKIPLPAARPLRGFHRRATTERLDLLAYFYLKDATAFWQLCDANNAMVPDALGSRGTIGIPAPPV